MTSELEKLEKELKNSKQGSDYSISNDNQGEKNL